MHAIARNRLARTALLGLALLIALSASAATTRSLAIVDGQLWLDPSSIRVAPGETTDLVMQLDNVTNVYGIDVALSFDHTVLAVVDANAGAGGVQIATGACPAPDFVVTNAADNAAGTIEYVASQLLPTAACDGGAAATITVECLQKGESEVAFTFSQVVDPDGWDIDHTTQSSTVTCSDEVGVYLPMVLKAY